MESHSFTREPLIPVDLLGRTDLSARVIAHAEAAHRRMRASRADWSAPYDPETIAGALGLPVVRDRMRPGIDAMLVPDLGGGPPVIMVDRDTRSGGRLTFSLAHEIAHTFFDDAGASLKMRTKRRDEETPEDREMERLCDLGAAELLMPRDEFRATAAAREFGPSAVPDAAGTFAVSLEAAAVRLLQLGDERMQAVALFDYAVRPSLRARADAQEVPEYRVRRAFVRNGVPHFLPHGKSVPRTSAVYRASMTGETVAGEEALALGRRSLRFHVAAAALPNDRSPGGPPAVCAVFRAV